VASPHLAPVQPLPFQGGDAELVVGLVQGDARARAATFDRFAPYVERLLVRTLGRDDEVEDALQETFEVAFRDAHRLRSPDRLQSWLASIAVFVARGMLRKRKRRWLRFFDPVSLPETIALTDVEVTLELKHALAAIDALPHEERIAFTLRRLEGMELTEVAEAMGISLATVKRRLTSAEQLFDAALHGRSR
jgi:RNA polymerase sigma-70 factor, ECF subfamily